MQSLNYCLVSNLFILEKVIEKINGRQLQNYLQVLNFSDISQSPCTDQIGQSYPGDENQEFTLFQNS